MIEAGSVIAGRYRLEHLLGEGGMGAVWAATHTLTHKRVAIKLLKAEIASADSLRRFVREARAASAVRHPNVVEVHDILTLDDGSPAMVMDFLEGETLAQFLARTGPIAVLDLAAIMAPVVSAVASAHAAGIVHRDLKPDNIFLARLGDGRIEPMVLDFGIAKVLPFTENMNASALTHTGAVLGTPYYMAPEQAFGEKDVDARADVWALGVILYECSSGRKPIEGETLGQVFKSITAGKTVPLEDLVPHLPAEFVSLVHGMIERDRERRTPDLRQPFEKLRALAGSSPRGYGAAVSIQPPPPSSLPFQATAHVPLPAPPGTGSVVSSAQGLGASAVPVTRGVSAARKGGLSPLVVGGGVLGALSVAALLAVALRQPTAPVEAAARSAAIAASVAASSSASVAPSASAAAAPVPSSSAEAVSAPSASVPAPARKPRSGTAKPSTPRKLLPGGVDEAVPF
jgi:eukaryotic-like serine/threonine-protein kinase